ncbi:MAG TPA: DHH family phosphoesterase, partial [Candidatus Sulfotelmatobacter sp.]|nr:DHH family phosphoesterase [Candidatus Sulfotelmatobacter sp.]
MGEFYPRFSKAFGRLLADVSGRTVAVVGHSRPDGDCIGSQAALARVLAARGSRTLCVNSDSIPRRLGYLARGLDFMRTDEALLLPADTVSVFVDCADHARAGERLKARFPSPAGNIDHHLSNSEFAAINIVDNASAATCEVLAGLFIDAGLPIDAGSAAALFAGIMTDTGGFRFNSTSQRSFVLAGELVARGASPSEAGYELYERESSGSLRLLGIFLASLEMEFGGRVCIGTLPPGVFEATGTSAEDTEGLVDFARCVDGVDIGVLIEERRDGGVKASLRAKDPLCRLDLVAGQFGGGGHACAAGLSLKKPTGEF